MILVYIIYLYTRKQKHVILYINNILSTYLKGIVKIVKRPRFRDYKLELTQKEHCQHDRDDNKTMIIFYKYACIA